MNGRWAARILGLIMILVFFLLMMNLQRQLLLMQRQRQQNPRTTTQLDGNRPSSAPVRMSFNSMISS